ncbi:MAG: hypothetical protein FJ118_19610 [Deltaproteobacteria bacterium]|nr:hypothetical protein [Deltaproteobacteria bacterium]
MYTIGNEWPDVSEDIAALPNLQGYGNVYDLHEAMARDTSGDLASLVEQFVGTAESPSRSTLVDQILFKWTGTDGINPGCRGPNIDARKLAVLEKFFGQSFVGSNGTSPTYESSILLNESYRVVYEMTYGQLMVQTHLAELYRNIQYVWDDQQLAMNFDLRNVVTTIQQSIAINPEQGKQLLAEFARSVRGIALLPQAEYLFFRETFIQQDPSLAWVIDTGGLPVYDQLGQGDGWWYPHMWGTWNSDAVRGSLTEGDGYINGLTGNDVIYGTSRNEYLFNQDGDALLYGGGGNDELWSGEGNDILDGGTGNDRLFGEAGNDTYMFRRGSGQDIIIDPDPTADNADTIWLGSNLTPEEVVLRRSGNNLVLRIKDTNDVLTVQDYFKNDSLLNRVEQIQFMDGAVWTHDDILLQIVAPTEGDDIIYGGAGDDAINGAGGNDALYGNAGNDALYGLAA